MGPFRVHNYELCQLADVLKGTLCSQHRVWHQARQVVLGQSVCR